MKAMHLCPGCGANTVPHCSNVAPRKFRPCAWWRCINKDCQSFGVLDEPHRWVDQRPPSKR